MKIALYNLHFATMGGGERRTAALAAHLRAKHEVVLFVYVPLEPKLVEEVFDIEISGIEIVALGNSNHFQRISSSAPDLFINNSHLSTLPCPAPLGIYMCMFPEGYRIDLSSYSVITANSQYTASWIQRRWGYNAEVVYSACASMGPPGDKEKRILSVGRFWENVEAHHKRQDILLRTFVSMVQGNSLDWHLHMIGNVGTSIEDRKFVDQLRRAAEGQPIEISVGVSFDRLRDEYRRSSIYWHGAGYGSLEAFEPGRQEHFGMSIVEAMSAGCVPFAFNSGGPREIIRSGVSGYLWNDLDDLKRRTIDCIGNPERLGAMSIAAVAESERFNVRNYLERMDSIIANLTD